MEALLCTRIIDAHEGRDVDNFDVMGAYIHAEITKYKRILIKLRGDFVDIMCQFNPEYKHNMRYEYGENVLYLRVLKEISGCIESELLWYKILFTTLE